MRKKSKASQKGGQAASHAPSHPSTPRSSYVPLTSTSSRQAILDAALRDTTPPLPESQSQRGALQTATTGFSSLDRGTLAQCLNATSQIAAECNRILRELLRERGEDPMVEAGGVTRLSLEMLSGQNIELRQEEAKMEREQRTPSDREWGGQGRHTHSASGVSQRGLPATNPGAGSDGPLAQPLHRHGCALVLPCRACG